MLLSSAFTRPSILHYCCCSIIDRGYTQAKKTIAVHEAHEMCFMLLECIIYQDWPFLLLLAGLRGFGSLASRAGLHRKKRDMRMLSHDSNAAALTCKCWIQDATFTLLMSCTSSTALVCNLFSKGWQREAV